MHHVLCTTCVLSRRGAAAAAAGIETSGPSSQLGGETLYWSFGKMGAPLYRQTGHSPLCSQHMRSPVHAASWQAAHVDPRLGQDVGSQGGNYALQGCGCEATLWTSSFTCQGSS